MQLKKDFKILFMGTPEFAAESLQNLVKHNFNIVGVVTSADKPAGRGQKINESAVKITARNLNLYILQPTNLKAPEFIESIKKLNADLFVVVAFRMLPEIVWAMPPQGTINLHASILPNYRGAAPINRAIMNGETKTGLTTFFIEKEIDTGKIIDVTELEIGAEENAGELHDRMMKMGAELLVKTCESIFKKDFKGISQIEMIGKSGELISAPKIFKNDCKVDWSKSTSEIYNFIRGLSPYPTAYTEFMNEDLEKTSFLKIFKCSQSIEKHSTLPGKIVSDAKKTLKIACMDGFIEILDLQLEGKKRMKTAEFLNGISISKFKIVI